MIGENKISNLLIFSYQLELFTTYFTITQQFLGQLKYIIAHFPEFSYQGFSCSGNQHWIRNQRPKKTYQEGY